MTVDYEAVGLRIKLIRGAESQGAFGKRFNLTQSDVSRLERGAVKLDIELLINICSHFNKDMRWLILGDDAGGGVARETLPYEVNNKVVAEGDYVFVPHYSIEVTAGHGGEVIDEGEVISHLAFSSQWVRSELGLDAKALILITATGDSMDPDIRHGDIVLINTLVRTIVDDAIYVINIDGRLFIKRVQTMAQGGIKVSSSNPAYEAFEIDKDEPNFLKVIGRVVWTGRKV